MLTARVAGANIKPRTRRTKTQAFGNGFSDHATLSIARRKLEYFGAGATHYDKEADNFVASVDGFWN